MAKLFILLLFIFTFIASPSLPKEELKIVAVVGDIPITNFDVNERIKINLFASGLKRGLELEESVHKEALENLINDKLFEFEAKRLNIEIPEADMDKALKSIELKNKVEAGTLKEFLESKFISYSSFVDQVRMKFIKTIIMNRYIRPKIFVSEYEVKEKKDSILSQDERYEYNISEVVFPLDDMKKSEKVKLSVEKFIKKAKKSKNIETFLNKEVKKGKIYYKFYKSWIHTYNMLPNMIPVVKKMEVGDISKPVKSSKGYHVTILNKRRLLLNSISMDSEIGIKQMIFKRKGDSKKDFDLQSKKISLVNNSQDKVSNCSELDDFALKNGFSTTKIIKTQFKKFNEMTKNTLLFMSDNNISNITKINKGFYVIMACEVSVVPFPMLDDNKIYEYLFVEKSKLQMKHYLENIHHKAFIEFKE